jgi:hypothetical protein
MPDMIEKTNCYTYKVEMIIQILAKDLPTAADRLNVMGGHITSRKVELLETTQLPVISEKKLKTVL